MTTHDTDVLTGEGARRLVEQMVEAASSVLASLSPGQRSQAQIDITDHDQRTSWYYTPRDRAGLPLAGMERDQQRLTHQLVAAGLSRPGYVTAATIMGLETILDAREDWRWSGRGRDPLLYYLTIFGEPSPTAAWGWRFEGHHISVNYTIDNGRVIAPTPTFFGANPADAVLSARGGEGEVGPVALLRPLAPVEDLARDLVRRLDETQRATAILSPTAPDDILSRNRPQVFDGAADSDVDAAARLTPEPRGLPGSAMRGAQREILDGLVREYLGRMPDEIAEIEMSKLEALGLGGIHFAWAGGLERHQPHYYRLQAPQFLVEYDNTQNNANHIHSVWRDPTNDFGADLIARHYAQSGHHAGQ